MNMAFEHLFVGYCTRQEEGEHMLLLINPGVEIFHYYIEFIVLKVDLVLI